MATDSRLRTRLAVLTLAVLVAGGCTPVPPPQKPARIDVTPPELSRHVQAKLAQPGLSELTTDTVIAVGTLRYRDLEGGYWAVDTRSRWNARETTSDVVVANASRLATDLQALDGQNVAVGGTMVENGASIRMGGPEMNAAWIGLVSDLAHASPTNRYGVGLYTLETGEAFVNGWLERRDGELVVHFKRHERGTASTSGVALETSPAAIPPVMVGGVAEFFGFVEGIRDGLPLFHVLRMGGWTNTPAFGGSMMITGRPPRWRHIEPSGLKDAPNGRKRVVGVLSVSEDGTFTVGGVPWMSPPGAPAAAVEASGAAALRLQNALGKYVAVVGRIVGSSSSASGRWGRNVSMPLVSAETVTVVTTMTPSGDEMVMLRGGGHY